MMATQRKRQSLSKTADELFGKVVRAPGVCYRCGTEFGLQCAHGFSRSYRATRWDLRNGFCLCRGCHVYFTHRPIEWDNWLQVEWGDDLYAEMRALALSGVRPDHKAIIADLRERLRLMEAAA
ncbi:MAG TPA: HNH endonuclease [Gemmatimonadaceae bacterium]|nr:HNH endonuclease [Gemmatimonadaceae bacterium]